MPLLKNVQTFVVYFVELCTYVTEWSNQEKSVHWTEVHLNGSPNYLCQFFLEMVTFFFFFFFFFFKVSQIYRVDILTCQ